MKKAALTTAILAVMASGSAAAATVYKDDTTELKIGGRAEARFNISDNNESDTDSTFADKSRARLNIVGKSQISDDLYGFGKYEAEFDTDASITNRYAFAGLGTNFGEFSYGKQDSAQVILTDITDTMATFGADSADIVAGNKDKRSNNFLYAGEFGGLNVQANYIASDEKDADSYGISALYGFDFGLDLGLGYVGQTNGDDDDSQINFAAQYSIADFTLGGFYGLGSVADEDVNAFEISALYKLNKWTFVAVYNYNDVDTLIKQTKTGLDEVDNFAIEAVYKFNGNLRTYAGYKFEQVDNQDDQIQAGIRYDF
ncbi:putative outer membrane protein [Vibrio ishigakensis]|uniref:Putative outer membrane protein n=1 Tax=Vibrio ishigakensis TaxID=1481914 RepID=A0A0B8P620_9VIBR|nr:porin [Vibrio ishigakensis]GAM58374.1 putative outer membrane protein [Vibrio ishigakensis]